MILFQHTRKSYFPQLFSSPTEQSTLTDTYLNQFIEIQPFYCDLFPTVKCKKKNNLKSKMQFDSIFLPHNSHDPTTCIVKVLHTHISASEKATKIHEFMIYFLLTFNQSSMQRKSECTEEEKKKGEKPHQSQTTYTVSGFTYTLTVLSSLASYKK